MAGNLQDRSGLNCPGCTHQPDLGRTRARPLVRPPLALFCVLCPAANLQNCPGTESSRRRGSCAARFSSDRQSKCAASPRTLAQSRRQPSSYRALRVLSTVAMTQQVWPRPLRTLERPVGCRIRIWKKPSTRSLSHQSPTPSLRRDPQWCFPPVPLSTPTSPPPPSPLAPAWPAPPAFGERTPQCFLCPCRPFPQLP